MDYSADNWFWIVGDGPAGQVYASRRFAYVAPADAEYQAFLASGAKATLVPTVAELRDIVLAPANVRYLGESLPPLEEPRPRVHAARLRLQLTGQVLTSGIAAALQWSGTGDIDPLGMHNPSSQPAQITIPATQAGVYLYSIAATIAASPTGTRALQFRRGAGGGTAVRGTTVRLPAPATAEWEFFGSRPVALGGGDLLRVFAQQDSGASLAIDAEIALLRIE